MVSRNGLRRALRSGRLEAALGIIVLLAVTAIVGCKSGGETGSGSSGGAGATGGSKAGGEFEGVVNMTMDADGKAIQMTYYLKSDRMRTETSMPSNPELQGVMIMELGTAKMTTLMPQQKMYMTTDLKQMSMATDSPENKKFPKITDTGRKETVAGYNCEHYIIGDEQNVDMCVAKGLGYFGMGGGGGRSGGLSDLIFSQEMKAEAAANPEWSKFLEGGAFPLKMTVTEGGKTNMSAQVTSVERKKLDDSLFAVPADYKEMKIPGGIPMGSVPRKTGQ